MTGPRKCVPAPDEKARYWSEVFLSVIALQLEQQGKHQSAADVRALAVEPMKETA